MEALVEVLVGAAPGVVDAHRVVGRDRAVEEAPARPAGVLGAEALERPPLAPLARISCSCATRSGFALTGRNIGPRVGGHSRSGFANRVRTGVRVSYRAMHGAQESRPRAKFAVRRRLPLPPLSGSRSRVRGRRPAGARLCRAADPRRRARSPGSPSGRTASELIALRPDPWVLPGVFVLNLVLLVYRLVAIVDAYRVTVWLNALAANGGGRLGRPRLVFNPLSLAGLLAVILVMAGGHVVVARYDLLAIDCARATRASSSPTSRRTAATATRRARPTSPPARRSRPTPRSTARRRPTRRRPSRARTCPTRRSRRGTARTA